MIVNTFIQICDIYRKDTSSDYGGKGADKFTLFREDEPCLLIQTAGKREIDSQSGRETSVDGYIRIETQIHSTDRLVINSYNYDVLNVKEVRNLVTEAIEYYQGSVVRGRETDESAITIVE